jgi:hypothetical protein
MSSAPSFWYFPAAQVFAFFSFEISARDSEARALFLIDASLTKTAGSSCQRSGLSTALESRFFYCDSQTRLKTVGFKNFQGDEYFIIFTFAFFTMDVGTVHVVCKSGMGLAFSH